MSDSNVEDISFKSENSDLESDRYNSDGSESEIRSNGVEGKKNSEM